MSQRRGGKIQVQRNGEIFDARGNWTYNLGIAKKEAIVGADVVHGFKELPQVPFIEGEITDRGNLDLSDLLSGSDDTITIELANGKMIVLRNAWFAGEGTGNTEEGNLPVRWEGLSAEEIS